MLEFNVLLASMMADKDGDVDLGEVNVTGALGGWTAGGCNDMGSNGGSIEVGGGNAKRRLRVYS